MKKDVYLAELKKLKERMDSITNTPFNTYAKVVSLVTMNMRYEKVAFNPKLKEHPYLLTKEIITRTRDQFDNFLDMAFIENKDKKIIEGKSSKKEEKHRELFNEIWDRYGHKDYVEYVDRYIHRIKVNNLERLIRDKRSIDLGCGNGNFCIALLKCGGSFAAGIDYGGKSIVYARNAAKEMGFGKKSDFRHESVYETSYPDDSFDFAIQNGVFHHLDNEANAIKEAGRILKEGGWFWYYTDGGGGISYDLWDTSVYLLRSVPVLFIENILKSMNVSRNKIVHIMDGLSATYAHTSWDKITKKLSSFGFGNFKRLTGGFNTDCDLDRIELDPYGKEKFGEGDLRILCQLIKK